MRRFKPTASERIVSALSYLTVGWIGLIYFIILYFAKKQTTYFLRYNVFQSIFISLLYFVLSMAFGLIANLLLHIPYVNYLVSQILFFFNKPVLQIPLLNDSFSVIQVLTIGLTLYLAIMAVLGKYPRIYKISSIIDRSAR